jgi:hypothetical protein
MAYIEIVVELTLRDQSSVPAPFDWMAWMEPIAAAPFRHAFPVRGERFLQ